MTPDRPKDIPPEIEIDSNDDLELFEVDDDFGGIELFDLDNYGND
jgi:hypothetical protein